MDINSLTRAIKQKALELGFNKIGIARVEELPEAKFLMEWLKKGFHGEMKYMKQSLEKRLNPQKLLPNAKSIICVAINYYTQDAKINSQFIGKISRYARGDDYHKVIFDKLSELENFIIEKTDAVTRICVDTNPILEKLWARKAGIGWQGKIQLLLHANLAHGSFSERLS